MQIYMKLVGPFFNPQLTKQDKKELNYSGKKLLPWRITVQPLADKLLLFKSLF